MIHLICMISVKIVNNQNNQINLKNHSTDN